MYEWNHQPDQAPNQLGDDALCDRFPYGSPGLLPDGHFAYSYLGGHGSIEGRMAQLSRCRLFRPMSLSSGYCFCDGGIAQLGEH